MFDILIVDDEAHIRTLYRTVFIDSGYRVEIAAGCDEALKLMEKTPFDLIILDIELENESGLDLLNIVRQRFRDCAIILNSAYSTYKSDFQSWLADAYIMKTSDLGPLKDEVKNLLGESSVEPTRT